MQQLQILGLLIGQSTESMSKRVHQHRTSVQGLNVPCSGNPHDFLRCEFLIATIDLSNRTITKFIHFQFLQSHSVVPKNLRR
ncbi:hypothetical protein SLE2022_242280 [Rubroshorea leprosula]